MKVTLTHIGAFSLGRLLAVWSFVLGVILLVIATFIMLIMALLGLATSNNTVEVLGGGIIGIVLFLIVGVFGLVINSVLAFILGALAATVYNIVLKVGGGIDLGFDEK